MEELFGIRDVKVVPNAVDTSVFRPDLPSLPEIADGRKTALFVGRLDMRKGVDTLMEAWDILSERMEDFKEKYKLVVVGNGPLKGRVVDAVSRHGNVMLYDNVPMGDPDFPRFYTSSDFAVFPAKGGEAFGIVILEAFASGRPVVVTDIPGYNEVATPETALFVSPDDPVSLSRAMERMTALFVSPDDPVSLSRAMERMFLDDDLRAVIGRNALRRSRMFSWDAVIDRFLELYDSPVE